jgi:hypothetical protein
MDNIVRSKILSELHRWHTITAARSGEELCLLCSWDIDDVITGESGVCLESLKSVNKVGYIVQRLYWRSMSTL